MAMTDDATTIGQLRAVVKDFVDQRDWQQFHAPKNLSMALAIEAAELMELFQWLSVADSRTIHKDAEKYQQVKDELADVMCYALALANELQIDLTTALSEKMVKNVRKYPASEYRGKFELD